MVFRFAACAFWLLVCHFTHTEYAWGAGVEHFVSGEFHGSLHWDAISATESGVYRFGGSAAWFVLDGLALGYEQQFILPRGQHLESRSWLAARVVPFRDWPLVPYLALRVGYFYLPDTDAPATGIGCGLTFFLSDHLAFEASFRTQLVWYPHRAFEQSNDVETHFALYF